MKFLIKKYKNLTPSAKSAFWICTLGFICSCLFFILNCKAWHIPTDDEIHYTKGKIYVVPANYTQRLGGTSSVGHIELHTDDGKKMYFTCSYTALDTTQYSSCRSLKPEYKNTVHRKYGEVGWYMQKPFLGIKNPHPQLVSMAVEKNGKMVMEKTKERSIERMSVDKKDLIFMIILTFGGFYGIFFLPEILNKKPKQPTTE